MDEIEKLEEKIKALEMKKARYQGRSKSENKQLERKADTRKKIIVGAIFSKHFDIDLSQSEEQISELSAIIASVFEQRVRKFKDTIEGVNDNGEKEENR